jgi:hypothetical protein
MSDTTENDLLEMSNHFKEVLDRKDKELNAIKKKHNELLKTICVCYSILRIADDLLDNIDYPNSSIFFALHKNLEYGRTECSNSIHNYLPKVEDEEDEEINEVLIAELNISD